MMFFQDKELSHDADVQKTEITNGASFQQLDHYSQGGAICCLGGKTNIFS